MKKLILIMILILNITLLTSCWDNMDLTEKAFVTAMGVDKTEDGKIELTLQIVKPSSVSMETKISEGAIWVLTTFGDTLFEAVKNQLSTSNRKPFYNHAELLVIGENYAKEGIEEVLDFWERNHEPRLNANILVAKGTTAKRILNAESKVEEVYSVHINGIINNNEAIGKIKKTTVMETIKANREKGNNPVICAIEIINDVENLKIKDMVINSSAVFKNNKLIGYLNPEETKGLLFIKDELKSGVINVKSPKDNEDKISIEINNSKTKIESRVAGDSVYFTINIETLGTVSSEQGYVKLATQENIEKLNIYTEEKIKMYVDKAFKKAQKDYKTDFFGFGDIVYRKHLDFWRKYVNDWDKIFENVTVNVNVNVEILNSGIIKNPSKPA